jgi:micrococcal nuclease
VLRVIDGITIDVKDESGRHRVRYLGVEVRPDGPLGRSRLSVHAEELNRYLVEGRTVQLERDVLDVDASGELLRYVYVDGEMVNMALLANGFATVADSPAVFAYRASFLALAEAAQASAQGAIAGPGAVGGPAVSQTPGLQRAFGTLPVPEDTRRLALRCDFSDTGQPLIKAIVDARTAERLYHVPGGPSYSSAVVDAANGDGWFCTEVQAVADGWKRSPQ